MKKIYVLPAALLLGMMLLIAGCEKPEGDPDELECGGTDDWVSIDVYSTLIYNDLDIVSGNRTFIYEDISTPENICIDEPISVMYRVDHMPGGIAGSNITITGKAYYGQSGEYETPMPYTAAGNYSKGEDNVDIGSQFSINPGWVGLQVRFVFPTQGSFSADSIYLHTYVQGIVISCDYQIAP